MTLEARLEALTRAAATVRALGLETIADEADAVVERATARAGFPGTTFVMALAGGTGVGKSSVLNAVAGRTVSAVRAVRPTTDAPIAWVAEARRKELAPLLEWLDIEHVATHADPDLERVAILDLPDVDSVRTEHRALVDRLLPRIDAVTWVVDPEKYDDERLHAYLRTLADHAPRLRFVLNKADRVAPVDRQALRADLERRLSESGIVGSPIHVVAAATGEGIDGLRAAIAGEADAKAVVAAKLEADARAELGRIRAALGVEPGAAVTPLVPEARRAAAMREAVDGALAVVDLDGLARQVRFAVMDTARRRGGSLLARVVALLGWLSGQRSRRADPIAYLRDWRRRGTLARVVNPIRALLLEAAGALPSESRAPLLDAMGADEVEAASAAAIDRAVRAAASDLRLPSSWLWPVIGLFQLAAGAVFALAVAWYVTLFVAGGSIPVATVDLPWLGPLPLPLVLLIGSFVVSAALGWLVSLHAGWLARRASGRVERRVRDAVSEVIATAGMAGLERVEEARAAIGASPSAE